MGTQEGFDEGVKHAASPNPLGDDEKHCDHNNSRITESFERLFGFDYRSGETLASPSEDTIIREGDTLLLLGSVSAISSLWNILPPATDQLNVLARLTSSKRNIMEASIAPHSPVVGKNGTFLPSPKRTP